MDESPSLRGRFGESKVNAAIKIALDGNEYRLLKDVMLPTQEGTTQIDHVIISKFGIFVVETKNYSGWIFGGECQKAWSQTLFNKKFSFQNPLHQNHKHTETIISLLGIDSQNVFPIVVFVGESEFKTPMPDRVTDIPGMISYIKSKTVEVFTIDEVYSILNAFEVIRIESSLENINSHNNSLRSRFYNDNDRVSSKEQIEKNSENCDIPELSIVEKIRINSFEDNHQSKTDCLKSKFPISNQKTATILEIFRILNSLIRQSPNRKSEKYSGLSCVLIKSIIYKKTVITILTLIVVCFFVVISIDISTNIINKKTENFSKNIGLGSHSDKSFSITEIEKVKNELLSKKVEGRNNDNLNGRYKYLIELSSGRTIQADNGNIDGQIVTLTNESGLEMKIDLSQIKSVKKIQIQ